MTRNTFSAKHNAGDRKSPTLSVNRHILPWVSEGGDRPRILKFDISY